ncbi:MAG: alpha/beta fold hydrolase [Salana multivorans]|uniref:alpha/beta hydrolase n=1 Tax=Salana multivorans TaxID=120377 RepID=UPI001AC36CFB|nr:alpha/beta fold hydrolase [Salana multivorans]MBN8883462.1 alpha/beta fold hydrolase [Salana multivorans]
MAGTIAPHRRPADTRAGRRRRAAAGGALALALALAGCAAGDDAGVPAASSAPSPSSSATPSPSPSWTCETFEVTRDDVRIVGTLEVPELADGETVPLVILMHGLAASQDASVIRASATALREAGIATIRFDFDGHGASGGTMLEMTVPHEIEDAHAVYDYARSLPFVSDIGLLGHSQGGVVAAMLAGELGDGVAGLVLLAPAVRIPDETAAGRLIDAVFDPANPPASVPVPALGTELGRDYLVTAQELAVRDVPARFTGPVSIVQGEADDLIPASDAEGYVTIFADAGLHLLPEQDHSFYYDPAEPAGLAAAFFSDAFPGMPR